MRCLSFFISGLVGLFLASAPRLILAAPIDELIAGAKREGVIEFFGPATLTPEGGKALGDAFNRKYNLQIRVEFSSPTNFTRAVARLVGMAATGVPPDYDLMIVTDAHHGTLWLRKLHEPYDFRKIGIDPKFIHYDSSVISFANQFALPAYNEKILPSKDVPKKWEDLLHPKWKGGKLGVSSATHHLARLAAGGWGEERTTRFVRALAEQELSLGRLGELYNRLLLGEILVAVTLTDTNIHQAKTKGAPIVFAEEVRPVISPAYHAGVPKGARHPNAAHLFAAFQTSDEAQQIWEKFGGTTSAFVAGTAAHNYVQGKEAIYMNQDQAKAIDKLSREYGKILGFK